MFVIMIAAQIEWKIDLKKKKGGISGHLLFKYQNFVQIIREKKKRKKFVCCSWTQTGTLGVAVLLYISMLMNYVICDKCEILEKLSFLIVSIEGKN